MTDPAIALLIVGPVVLAYAALTAPEGYQDDAGWHAGPLPRDSFEDTSHQKPQRFGGRPDGAQINNIHGERSA